MTRREGIDASGQPVHRWGPLVFFAVLFFFCSADQVFATRVGGLNLRWGQLLLLGVSAWSLWTLRPGAPGVSDRWRALAPLALTWGAFFVAYAAAAALGTDPAPAFVKLAWAVFNIGGAAALCLALPASRRALTGGFVLGTSLTSLVILVDAAAMFWAGMDGPLVGFAQDSFSIDNVVQRRPHAFYYEPSYAGAMLAFATPLLLAATGKAPRLVRWGVPALAMSAAVLTTARTGLLSLFVAVSAAAVLGLLLRDTRPLRRIAASGLVATALLAALLGPTAAGQRYLEFLLGPLGPQGIVTRLRSELEMRKGFTAVKEPPPLVAPASSADPALPSGGAIAARETPPAAPPARELPPPSSEYDRLNNALQTLRHWGARPLLGWGSAMLPPLSQEGERLLRPTTMNTWLEVGVESGLVGFAAFALALFVSMRLAWRGAADRRLRAYVLAAWAAHFLVNLSFTQTFPRLDYWLLFFLSVRLAWREAPALAAARAPEPAPPESDAAPALATPANVPSSPPAS